MIEYFKINDKELALIAGDTHICKWIKEHRRLDFDRAMIERIVFPYIKDKSIIFNVGAYVGDTATALLPKAFQLHCFEPNPEAFECLTHNMKGTEATLCNFAISDTNHKYSLDTPNQNYGMINVIEGDQYVAMSLDNYCKAQGVTPDFIYCDIEGFELKMLKGAEGILKNHRPSMVLEINEPALAKNGTTKEEVFAYLDEMDYIYKEVYNTPIKKCKVQFDILCFHKKR